MKTTYDLVPYEATGSYFETPGGPRGLEAPMGQFYRGLGADTGLLGGGILGLAFMGLAVYGGYIALSKAMK